MRLAGTLDNQHDAATLIDYLLTLGIHAKPERNGEVWELWILDEDRVAEAKQELKAFQFQPEDDKYRAAAKEADRLRREKVDKAHEARRNVIRLPRSGAAAVRGRRPLTMMLFAATTMVFLTTDFGKKADLVDKLQIAEIRVYGNGTVDPSYRFPNMPEVRRGELWRLFTPMLLHFGIMHFVGNMYWLFEFGSQIEARRGTLLFALLVVVTNLACNFGQYWWDGPNFGGMSGVVFGLFGYLWIKTKFEPWLGFILDPSTIVFTFAWFFLCMTGAVGPIANAGHTFGFLAGVIFAGVPILLRRSR